MELYHILGALSSFLFLLTWFGLFRQLSTIEHRRRAGKPATQSLSVNQFASSYFAFYGNFFFGIAITPFNHYLVWTRLGALALTLCILLRICQDRKTYSSKALFTIATLAMLAGFISMGFRPYPAIAKLGANSLMLVLTALLIQGTIYQCWALYKTQQLGALSISLFRSILIKDISTLLFALTMPIASAWPLLILNGASVVTRGLLLLQMELLKHRRLA